MNLKSTFIGGSVLAAALLAPGLASASYVLDTGTPASPTGSPVTLLNTSQFVAAEFDLTSANLPINDLSVYMTTGVGNINDNFTVDIYSASSFTGRANQRTLLYSATGKFTGNGWIDVPLNTGGNPWTPTATGDYWVALQVSSVTQTHGLDLPGAGIGTTSGTAPALGFAFAGTNGQYALESTTAPTTPFGIRLSEATPVPLPATAWLLLSGLGGLVSLARRRAA